MALAADLDIIPEIPPIQDLVSRRVSFAADYIITAASESPQVIVLTGIMKGGKTETTAAIKSRVNRLTTYKNYGFNRNGSTDGSIYMNSGKLIQGVQPVMGLNGVRERLMKGMHMKGDFISVEEAAFMGSPEEADQLVDCALECGVTLVLDALGADFATREFPTTRAFIRRANTTFIMTGWDIVEPTLKSEANLRVVGITPDLNVLHPDGHYYQGDSARIHTAIEGLERAGLLEKLKIRKPDKFPDVEWCYGLPSDPNDPMLAIGSDRYFPMALKNYRTTYIAAGIADPGQFVSIHNLYPEATNKFDWASVGLA